MKAKERTLDRKESRIPEPERRMERIAGLLAGGVLLLNFPLLSIFSVRAHLFGMPLLYVYLFSVWFLIIGITAFVLRPGRSAIRKESADRDERER